MKQARFRFYAELNDFLPQPKRGVSFWHEFAGHPSIKDTIEAIGVPHTEVDLILTNGHSVGFDYKLDDGDRLGIYPVFESIDISPILRVRPQPLRRIRFVLDTHLGKLAAYLRMLGFDSLYNNEAPDEALASLSVEGDRVLLTKDRGLLKRGRVTHGYYIRSQEPREQVLEVIQRFDLQRLIEPFTRCMRCNGAIEEVQKELILERLEPQTRDHFDEFSICSECDQIYWRGSHFGRMKAFIDHLLIRLERRSQGGA